MIKRLLQFSLLFLAGLLGAAEAVQPKPVESAELLLKPEVKVDSQGVYLDQLLDSKMGLPHTLLAPAPVIGKTVTFTKVQFHELLLKAAPDFASEKVGGAEAIKISRRTRSLEETEFKEMLRDLLQKEHVKERGALEIRFTRAWTPITIPDEPISLKILDLPVTGVTPNFFVRVEIRNGTELAGTWAVGLQARIMKEVWVARSPIVRKQLLSECELNRENRDILTLREAPADIDPADAALEVTESVPAGMPLLARSIRPKPVMHRGKVVDALVQDGSMTISAKVEVLEEGVPGQYVRVRNLKSKKEFRGKVQNEQTVLVSL